MSEISITCLSWGRISLLKLTSYRQRQKKIQKNFKQWNKKYLKWLYFFRNIKTNILERKIFRKYYNLHLSSQNSKIIFPFLSWPTPQVLISQTAPAPPHCHHDSFSFLAGPEQDDILASLRDWQQTSLHLTQSILEHSPRFSVWAGPPVVTCRLDSEFEGPLHNIWYFYAVSFVSTQGQHEKAFTKSLPKSWVMLLSYIERWGSRKTTHQCSDPRLVIHDVTVQLPDHWSWTPGTPPPGSCRI